MSGNGRSIGTTNATVPTNRPPIWHRKSCGVEPQWRVSIRTNRGKHSRARSLKGDRTFARRTTTSGTDPPRGSLSRQTQLPAISGFVASLELERTGTSPHRGSARLWPDSTAKCPPHGPVTPNGRHAGTQGQVRWRHHGRCSEGQSTRSGLVSDEPRRGRQGAEG